MNKIFAYVTKRAAVNAMLLAASIVQAQPEGVSVPLDIRIAAQRGGEAESVRRLVHLHYEQTDLLAQGANLSRASTNWSGGLDSQPDLSFGFTRGTAVHAGQGTIADVVAN
jgi:hypothetical protein